MAENYNRYGKYLKLDFISESFYSKSYKSKFFGTDDFYKIFSFDEISELVTEDPIVFDKFMRIIKTNSKLNHSNIIKIIDFHDFHGTYALISEYFSHEPLLALMASYFKRKKKIPVVVAVFIISQVCDAVGYAQSKQILHGNINPLNILITHEGLIKVKEFSFFNNLSVSTNVKALNFKQFRYIAPEKFSSNQIVPQSDVYSLAVMLYEMLTGKIIYSSKDMNVLIDKIKEGKFIPINRLNPDVPEGLAKIVEQALNLEPSERFEDPIKFKYAIQRYLIQGNKIFSAQHFYSLVAKLFSSSVSREVAQNSSYKKLVLNDYQNLLKPIEKPIEMDSYFTPDIDDDLFEGEDEATSILFDNVDDIQSVDEIESLKPKNTKDLVFKIDDGIYEEDDETSVLDDEDEFDTNSIKADEDLYDDDEATNILDESDEEDEEDSTDIKAQKAEKQKSRKKNKKNNETQEKELINLLNNKSDFNAKSFIIGLVVGLAIGLAITFLK